MWINEYMNELTCGAGVLALLVIFINQIIFMAYGEYFIKLKSPVVNGFVNFVILCVIYFISGLVVYYLSLPFYDPNLNSVHIYFFSIVFYLILFCIIMFLLYAFFYKLGNGA